MRCIMHNYHSHKKQKDSLEGSPDLVLFVAKLEFPNILVPRLPQNTSNVNMECVGKPKQLYSLCDQPLGLLMSLFYCSDINLYRNKNNQKHT